jgi:hypothetical protein
VTNPAIVGLAPTGTLQDRFTYTVSDGKGGTATATLTLNIAGANTPPVAQPDTVSTNEDTPVTFPVLGNDSDPEGDPHRHRPPDPAQGSVVVNPDGTLSFTPPPTSTARPRSPTPSMTARAAPPPPSSPSTWRR